MPTNPISPIYAGRTYKDYDKNYLYDTSVTPSTGSAKILVIPVWFTDSNNFIAVENKDIIREDIRKSYFGANEETGWRSVKTYYEEESHGQLTIDGTVSEWYSESTSYNTYGPEDALSNTVSLVTKASKWYFDNHTTEKRRDYDADGDGYHAHLWCA